MTAQMLRGAAIAAVVAATVAALFGGTEMMVLVLAAGPGALTRIDVILPAAMYALLWGSAAAGASLVAAGLRAWLAGEAPGIGRTAVESASGTLVGCTLVWALAGVHRLWIARPETPGGVALDLLLVAAAVGSWWVIRAGLERVRRRWRGLGRASAGVAGLLAAGLAAFAVLPEKGLL